MNQCNFIGTLGKDAEVKTLESGKTVINFSIAVNEGYGENKSTMWIDCAKWGEKTTVAQFLKKGSKVAVSGNVGLRKWETGATITLRISELHLIGGKAAEPTDSKLQPAGKFTPITPVDENPEDLPF